MVFGTRALLMAVWKTTGGRAWNKPWGVKRMTEAQKLNKRARHERMSDNAKVLREAAARETAAREAASALRGPAAAAAITTPAP
eukprot:CAMPEP_0177750832 /NCGR_PEP_ID=MMETSP0491_2-20121128/49_1 /TAXON_ID=63592 /ORGANISM="Tetraselmis chuii, Strain PLY429" /LENGTH=83 /DNA_ID=CAMNT_0019265901 /DNA_START=141 /DNA_END=392 /DNA_ORIENTATION=+